MNLLENCILSWRFISRAGLKGLVMNDNGSGDMINKQKAYTRKLYLR